MGYHGKLAMCCWNWTKI